MSDTRIAELSKGKDSQQQKVIKYFLAEGCLGRMFCIKDDEYDQMVRAKFDAPSLRKRALGRIGLDEDQLKEIPPVFISGYDFEGDRALCLRQGSDRMWRSSRYEGSWLFFSDSHVYMYYYRVDMISNTKSEQMHEYFYKDITSFSMASESREQEGKIYEASRFSLIVPGDKFNCSASGTDSTVLDRSLSAMKQKLREKKQ